jgi:hypothetical protein
MISITFSQFTNPAGQRVGQVMVGASPVCPETDPEEARGRMREVVEDLYSVGARLTVREWDADANILTVSTPDFWLNYKGR